MLSVEAKAFEWHEKSVSLWLTRSRGTGADWSWQQSVRRVCAISSDGCSGWLLVSLICRGQCFVAGVRQRCGLIVCIVHDIRSTLDHPEPLTFLNNDVPPANTGLSCRWFWLTADCQHKYTNNIRQWWGVARPYATSWGNTPASLKNTGCRALLCDEQKHNARETRLQLVIGKSIDKQAYINDSHAFYGYTRQSADCLDSQIVRYIYTTYKL